MIGNAVDNGALHVPVQGSCLVSTLNLHQINRAYVLFVIDIINILCCPSN